MTHESKRTLDSWCPGRLGKQAFWMASFKNLSNSVYSSRHADVHPYQLPVADDSNQETISALREDALQLQTAMILRRQAPTILDFDEAMSWGCGLRSIKKVKGELGASFQHYVPRSG